MLRKERKKRPEKWWAKTLPFPLFRSTIVMSRDTKVFPLPRAPVWGPHFLVLYLARRCSSPCALTWRPAANTQATVGHIKWAYRLVVSYPNKNAFGSKWDKQMTTESIIIYYISIINKKIYKTFHIVRGKWFLGWGLCLVVMLMQ